LVACYQWSRHFRLKQIFLIGRQQDFIKIKEEEDHFLEKKHMKEQVKVRIIAKIEVETEEVEE
jgi:hypothetical protein